MPIPQFKEDGVVKFDDPFFVRQFSHVFPDDFYARLSDEFPVPDEHWGEQGGLDRKIATSSSDDGFFDVARQSRAWSEFIRGTLNREFARNVGRLVYPGLKRYKEMSKIPPRLPRDFSERLSEESRFLDLIDERMTLGLQFARLANGQFNSPHSDTVSKIATILFYFPQEGWRNEYGGGTHFFRFRDEQKPDWFDPNMNRVPRENLDQFWKDTEAFFVSNYAPNTACLFCKSVDSFHAIGRIRAPEGLSRRAVVMTLRYREEGEENSWEAVEARAEAMTA
jgi:hypothetical protein